MEDLDRPLPHRRSRRPPRKLVRRLLVRGEGSNRRQCTGGVDGVDLNQDLRQLPHPYPVSIPLWAAFEFGHQHCWRPGEFTVRITRHQDRRWSRHHIHEFEHTSLVTGDVRIIETCSGRTYRRITNGKIAPPRATTRRRCIAGDDAHASAPPTQSRPHRWPTSPRQVLPVAGWVRQRSSIAERRHHLPASLTLTVSPTVTLDPHRTQPGTNSPRHNEASLCQEAASREFERVEGASKRRPGGWFGCGSRVRVGPGLTSSEVPGSGF